MDEYTKITSSLDKLKKDLSNDLLSAGFITGIILGIIGFIILIRELGMFLKIHSINKWPITKNGGTIINSKVENVTTSKTFSIFILSQTNYGVNYRNRTTFVYKVNGNWYVGTQLSFYEPWNDNPAESRLESIFYKPGSTVDIRINPKNAAEAYILNKPYVNYLPLLVGIILAAIGVYSIIRM